MANDYNVPGHVAAQAFLCHLVDLAGYLDEHPNQVGVVMHDIFASPYGEQVLAVFEERTGLRLVPDDNGDTCAYLLATRWTGVYQLVEQTQEADHVG